VGTASEGLLLVPAPPPCWTLAPDLTLSSAERSALELGLSALTGRLIGVVVAGVRTVGDRHVLELETAAGPLFVMGPASAPPRRRTLEAMEDELTERLEMFLVLLWLEEGSPADGAVALSVSTAATDLEAGPGRKGLLAVMAALGELEERELVEVAWPRGRRREARVTLAHELRADAARLFGRPPAER